MNYLSMMKQIDKDTLFSIFEQGDEEVYIEHGVKDVLDNPFVLMGMILRGLENFDLMDMMYKRNYPEEYENVKNLIKYKYYNKLYRYLTKIDSRCFKDEYTIGEAFDSENVYKALDDLRVYYEGIEEYEKCSVIKNFRELLIDKVVTLK
jgi:hypothetical protein